jgi:hypothetical protein
MRSVPFINQAFCNHHLRELSACTEVCAKNHYYNRTSGHWLHFVSKSEKPPNFELTFYSPSWVMIPILSQNVKHWVLATLAADQNWGKKRTSKKHPFYKISGFALFDQCL